VKRAIGTRAVGIVTLAGLAACAATGHGDADAGNPLSVDNGGNGLGLAPGNGPLPVTTIGAVIRDFRFYDLFDLTTDPDFENPPYGIDASGNPSTGYVGPWDDHDIVADALGADGKPVYKSPGKTTLTTHGQAAFDAWYHDVPGHNYAVTYPLPLTRQSQGAPLQYDSEVQGVAYGTSVPDQGNGFFPIDDGSAHATPFGNQGKAHNYSFTVEIHTEFTYKGGEQFTFRGDDDVFVFIDAKLVINLGGVHGPEQAQVNIDSLGLTVGQVYPLDFFSAERHVTGSNIEFQTTLDLRPVQGQ
jgi:fibro-slime domain-containing protein